MYKHIIPLALLTFAAALHLLTMLGVKPPTSYYTAMMICVILHNVARIIVIAVKHKDGDE